MPELGPDTKFALSSHKAVEEFKEAKSVILASSCVKCFLFLMQHLNFNMLVLFRAAWNNNCACACGPFYIPVHG